REPGLVRRTPARTLAVVFPLFLPLWRSGRGSCEAHHGHTANCSALDSRNVSALPGSRAQISTLICVPATTIGAALIRSCSVNTRFPSHTPAVPPLNLAAERKIGTWTQSCP